MDQLATGQTAQAHALEMARWYYELAKLCVQAAEGHLVLGEASPLQEVDRALALNEVIRIRMATVHSAERIFRVEFQRSYIDHHVEQILALNAEPGN